MYKKLKCRMYAYDMTQSDICRIIGRQVTYVTNRFTGRLPFSINDIYAICDALEIPYEQIPEYFPRDGKSQKKSA